MAVPPMASLHLCSLILMVCSLFLGSAVDDPIYSLCNTGRNYTDKSTFQDNLGHLISSLSLSVPATGFANGTVGEVPNRVYGLMICRGDINESRCRECLAGISWNAATKCPRNKGATIFNELCHLRYSDQNFFGSSTGTEISMWNTVNVSDVPTFDRLLGELLGNLTIRASSSERRFANGSVDFTNLEKVYALVQCTRDLAPETCNTCLMDEISYIPQCCEAKKGARVIGGSCYLRYKVAPFFNASAAADPPAPPPPPSVPANTSPPPSGTPAAGDKKNKNLTIAVAIAVPLTVSFAIMAAIWICIRRKKLIAYDEQCKDGANEADSLLFDLDTLKLATMNFSDQNKLGEGGFGVVYQGVLTDRRLTAVKRLVTSSAQGIGELKNEVALVAKLHHRNLIRLMGYCLQAQEKLLVYEYLPNKSLDKFLFDPFRSKELTWEKRVNIIEGIARGLLYLHEDSQLKIVHRDLKASNILLDAGMNPKIADFGLARLFGNEQSHGNTNRIAGTFGYMAPEYVMHGQISTKSDVYSFGVLLLEIVTGRRCTGYYGSDPPTDLISYIWQHWEKGNPVKLVDKGITDGCSTEEVLRYIHSGLLCVQQDPLDRPKMSFVILMLNSDSTSLPAISPLSCLTYSSTIASGDQGMTNRPMDGPSMTWPPRNDVLTIKSDNTIFESF